MEENRKDIWQFPWRYSESVAVVFGIIVVGYVLQVFSGPFDFALLRSPVNGIVGGSVVLLAICMAWKRHNPLIRWFSGVPMAVTLIAGLLILGILMGMTPQVSHIHHGDKSPATVLGLRQMTSSWSFVLLYFLTLLSLGTLIVRRLIPFRKTDYAFYLNHIGLWILLFAGGLGASDMKRYVMYVREGDTEWRVYNDAGEALELPIAIRLNDFIMEEYPPQLAVIDRKTGNAQPEQKPAYLQLDDKPLDGKIGPWNISVKEYIHEAVRNNDSTYRCIAMPGATPAARIEVRDRHTDAVAEGWVCGGNTAQLFMTLPLSDEYTVVMTRPDPKRFTSDIDIFTQDGGKGHTLLEVNKPYRMRNWMIYQYGYDTEAGKLSSYSAMELVYDPWIFPVYIGIALLAAGSVCMLWMGNRRKEVADDHVE